MVPAARLPIDGNRGLNIKRAQTLAREIEAEIVESKLAPGYNVGNEAELAKRFSVGRHVLREALALVERGGRARVRRGNQGGLIVVDPSAEAIAPTLRNYLDYVTVNIEHQHVTRHVLDDAAVIAAMHEMNEADLERFTALIGQFDAKAAPSAHVKLAFDMHVATLEAASNPCLSVFSLAVATLGLGRLKTNAYREQVLVAHAMEICANRRDCLKAIIAADRSAALQATRRHYEINLQLWRESERELTISSKPSPESKESIMLRVGLGLETPKLAEEVAQRIQADIIDQDLKPGDRVGSEVELQDSYGVGRGVMREAIRVLERLSIVSSTRGKRGGVRVARRDDTSMIGTICNYLQSLGVQHQHLVQVGDELDLLGITMATDRAPSMKDEEFAHIAEGIERLQPGASLAELSSRYYQFVGELSGNPPLTVLLAILSDLHGRVDLCGMDARVTAVDRERLSQLLDAVRAGQVELARRRMLFLRRHGARVRVSDTPRRS